MNTSNHQWETIRWHAGLLYNNETPGVAGQVALAEAICRFKRGERIELKASVEHLVLEIQKANLIINGSIPSESINVRNDVPLQLAYAVSTLITQCVELVASEQMAEKSSRFSGLTWMLSCAWDAVLAGDIDDVVEHLEIEANARGIIASENPQDELA